MSNAENIEGLEAAKIKTNEAWETLSEAKERIGEAIDHLLNVAGGESNLPSWAQESFDRLKDVSEKIEAAQSASTEAESALGDAQSYLS